jgi:hypothetical protein
MKTVQEYMNDPRLLNDPDMAGALDPIREIHAIRLKQQDETVGMTAEELNEYFIKKSAPFLARYGITLNTPVMEAARR